MGISKNGVFHCCVWSLQFNQNRGDPSLISHCVRINNLQNIFIILQDDVLTFGSRNHAIISAKWGLSINICVSICTYVDICLYMHLYMHLCLSPYALRGSQAAIDIYASTHPHTQSNKCILLVLFLKQSMSEIQSHKDSVKVSFLSPSGTNTKYGDAISPPHTLLVIPSFRK